MQQNNTFQMDPKWRIGKVKLRQQQSLRYAYYANPDPDAKWVVFISGRTEFIEKYNYFFEDLLTGANISILTWDHRGQGDSSGTKAHIDNYDTYAEDAAKLIKRFVKNKPYTIICHSMGGLISIFASMQGLLKPDKIIASSPFLDIPNKPLPKPLTRFLAPILSNFGLAKWHVNRQKRLAQDWFSNELTYCPNRFARIMQSPFHQLSPSFGWINESIKAIDFIHRPHNLTKWRVPTYLFIADSETVVDPNCSIRFKEAIQKHSKAFIHLESISHTKHELLSEKEKPYRNIVKKILRILNHEPKKSKTE